MGSPPEEFAELRRLLALKRAERPPPGYYNTFAGKVIARIEAEGLAAPKPWWVRWFSPAAWSPGLTGANTAIVAGVALLGGSAVYFKSRPARIENPAGVGRAPNAVDSSAALSSAQPDQGGVPQFTVFDSLPLPRLVDNRADLMHLPVSAPFHYRRPSIHDRVETTETDAIPAGIFEPWGRPSALPTSIVHQVVSPR